MIKNKEYLKYFPSKEVNDDTWSKWLENLTLNLDEKKLPNKRILDYY